MKETFYFSHDYNARSDEKIKRLIRNHWVTWYWIYWAIIEDLYNNANALHLDYEQIAFDLRTKIEIIESIINKFDLFIIKWNYFYSKSVWARLDQRNAKSEKARKSAEVRWWKNANALQPKSDSNTIKERKGKENKINKKESSKVDVQKVSNYKNKKIKLEEAFEKFRKLYPKKVNKKTTEIRFLNLSLNILENLFVWLDLYIKKWRIEQTAKQYIPWPDVWIWKEKWTDEIVCEGSPHNRTPVQNKAAIEKKKLEDKKQAEESAKINAEKKIYSDRWNSLPKKEQEKMRSEALKNSIKKHWKDEVFMKSQYWIPLVRAQLWLLIKAKI